MLRINFFKEVASPVTKKVVEKVVALSGRVEKKIKGEVEVTLVGEKEIKKLNKEYRGKNKITDVLSFSWIEKEKGNFLGQIYICYPKIKKQAKEFGVGQKEEFVRMLAHGLLHLVGHDHMGEVEANKMFKLQEKIVSEVKLKKII